MAKRLVVLPILCAACAWSQIAVIDSVESKRPSPLSETDKQIQTLQDHAKAAPGDYSGYDELGSAFFQKARETGDIAYYGLAEQTLKKALALAPQDFRAADPLVHMALVYMGEHRFADALAYAQKAIGTGSGNLAAFAIEGDAYTDMGDYDEAETAYNAMECLGRVTSSPLGLAYMSNSRMAYLSYLRGDLAEAIRLMKRGLGHTLTIRENPHRKRQEPSSICWERFRSFPSAASARGVRIRRHEAVGHRMPAQLKCGMHRNSSKGVSRRPGPAFHEWAPGCRRKFPPRTRLYRADNGKLLPVRYSGSCRSTHTVLRKRNFHLPVWSTRWPLTSPRAAATKHLSAPVAHRFIR
jgi:tetratricopeptide (TPR) repeat protein